MKKKYKSSFKKGFATFASLLVITSSMWSQTETIIANASSSQVVSFSESQSSSRSQTINIPDLVNVESVTSDTGNVTYSVNGENVTINVSGGTPTRTVWDSTQYSKSASDYRTSSSSSFSSTMSYSDSYGYSGTLYKSGSPYIISGSYTPSDTKWVTNQTSSYYNSGGYSGSLSSYLYSGSYTPSDSKTATGTRTYSVTVGYDDAWIGDCAWDNCVPSSISYNSGGYSGTLYRDSVDLTTYTCTGSTSSDTCYKKYTGYYSGTVVKPATDTRVYRYEGYVTKPSSDTRTWRQDYSGTVYKGGNDYYYAYNVTINYSTDNIPPNDPTFQANTTSPTNQDVSLTVNYSADSTLKQYKVGSGVWTSYTSPIFIPSNTTVYARAFDEAGNVSNEVSYQVSNIDKVSPNTPSLFADKTNPTNTDVEVTIQYPSDSYVKEYRVNNGSWTSYVSSVVFSENGKVEARAKDVAGNYSAIGSFQVSNIDKVAPNTPSMTPDVTEPTNKTVVVTASFPSDAVVKEVRVNNGSWISYTEPIVFNENGVIEARATDEATNTSTTSRYNVNNIDKVNPSTPVVTTKDNQNELTVSGTTDEESGIEEVSYRINSEEWKTYEETIELADGQYGIQVKSTDKAGNESDVTFKAFEFYEERLTSAENAVENAEVTTDQEDVDTANEKVDLLPYEVPEYEPLVDRVDDLEDLLDARNAIEKATETRSETDVKNAQEKVDLLDSSNPVIVNLLDEVQADFEVADILTLVAKERYDILSSKYGMSKVAYNSLVQTYYAIKYTGDTMYKMAQDKIVLVPADDKYYDLAYEQFNNLNVDYDTFVEERVQTDAEIKAESSVQVMEGKYDPTYAVHTQELINAVEDEEVRANLQERLDTAKAKYESSLLDKASQTAITAVEKAESTKNSYYVSEAYKKVNLLTDESLKSELTSRLQALEEQMAYEKQVADATRLVQMAEQYKSQYYIDLSQKKIDLLPDGEDKTSLQQRLDVVKSGLGTSDQAQIIKNATNYVSLAQTMKTQYYVDKAQGYVDQILDEVKKAELQAKLDAVVVK